MGSERVSIIDTESMKTCAEVSARQPVYEEWGRTRTGLYEDWGRLMTGI